MKIEIVYPIEQDGKEVEIKKEVKMRHPSGKEVKAVRQKLVEMQEKGKEEKGEVKVITQYLEFIDKIAIKCAKIDDKKITMDFLDSLPQDQKEKITSVIGYDAFGELDFTRLFGKPPA